MVPERSKKRIYGTLIAEISFGYRLFLYRGADFGQGRVVPEMWTFVGRKRPHFVQFKRLPPLALRTFRPSARQRGAGQLRFFCQSGHHHARHARRAHDAALRAALGQQLFHLGAASGPLGRRGHKPGPMPAGLALVAGMPAAMPVAPNLLAAAFGAGMLSRHREPNTKFIPI